MIKDYKHIHMLSFSLSWDQMEWNITGNVEIGNVDSEKELCVR